MKTDFKSRSVFLGHRTRGTDTQRDQDDGAGKQFKKNRLLVHRLLLFGPTARPVPDDYYSKTDTALDREETSRRQLSAINCTRHERHTTSTTAAFVLAATFVPRCRTIK